MRTKVTLVLAFLNLALFLFIFRYERAWRTERVASETRQRVLGAEAANLTSIAVVNASPDRSYRLERRPAGWFLTEPFVWPANPATVDSLRTDLQLLDDEASFSVEDMKKNGQSLAVYGLDHPALTVTIVSGGQEATGGAPVATTLRIGNTTRVGQRLYLLSADGERIHVVSRAILDSLLPPVERLRSDAVVTIPVFEATSLNLLDAAGQRVRIQRAGSRWLFETPVTARANKEAVELAINGLDALRVKSFSPGGSPPAAPAALRIGVEGDKRAETLFLEGPVAAASGGARDYYAQLEDLAQPGGKGVLFIVNVPGELERTLLGAADALRDRHVLDFEPSVVTAVALHAPGNHPDLVLQRLEPGAGAAAGWQVVLPADAGKGPRLMAADAGVVQHLLTTLALLSAERFKSDAPTDADRESWGLAQPERRVTLSLGGGTQVLEIGRSSPRDPFVYAQVANSQTVFAVLPDVLRETSVEPSDWRDRQVMTLPATARLTALALTDVASGKVVWAWGAASGQPRVPAARETQVGEVGARWRDLRAARFSGERFNPAGMAQGAWRYRLDGTFNLPGGGGGDTSSVHSLLLMERAAGAEQWAGSAEFDAVFLLDQPLIDALWVLTYGDRDPGRPAP